MLEILVNENYPLNLPEDIQVTFIEENPLFLFDRIPAMYSLSFEVPATPWNLKILGYPNRVTSKSIKRRTPATVNHSGLVMARGELIIIEVDNTLKLQFKGSREPEEVSMNLNQIDYGSYQYGSFQYHAEDLNYQSAALEEYVQAMRSQAYNANGYVIAPVRIKDSEWSGPEYRGGMVNSVKQYINYFNPVARNFHITDTIKAHTPILPFPYVRTLVEYAFGKYLEKNPFNTGDLARLILISQNHNYYAFDNLYSWYWVPPLEEEIKEVMFPLVDSYISTGGMIPLEWNVMNFGQAYSFREFLKNLLKIFCMTAYPGPTYRIELNNDVMDRPNRVNWDNKLAGELVISIEEAKDYVFRYSQVTKSEINLLEEYLSDKAIHDRALAVASESGSKYRNSATGALYTISRKLRGLDSRPWMNCKIEHSPLSTNDPPGERGKTEIISDLCPADMIIDQYWWQDTAHSVDDVVQKKHWWVPVVEKKSLSEPPYIMFWADIAPTFEQDGEYPLIMPHHTDHFGVKRLNTSLHPEGPGGLIEKFHNRMKEWTERDKTRAKGSFRNSLLDIKRLDIRDKIYVQGKLFYLEKMTYTLTPGGISLVDVDLIEC